MTEAAIPQATAETEAESGAETGVESGAESGAAGDPAAEIAQALSEAEALRLVEALLFAAAEPMTEAEIAAWLPEGADVAELLVELQTRTAGRGVVLQRRGRGWAFRTAPDLADKLARTEERPREISRAATETLATIAYHQPVTRAEIEAVRGVACSKGTLDLLIEAGWIKPGRRRESPGRPATWITTPGFLDHFGLEDLRDLPGLEELRQAGLLDTRPAMAHIGDGQAELGLDAAETGGGGEEDPDSAARETDADSALAEGRHDLT